MVEVVGSEARVGGASRRLARYDGYDESTAGLLRLPRSTKRVSPPTLTRAGQFGVGLGRRPVWFSLSVLQCQTNRLHFPHGRPSNACPQLYVLYEGNMSRYRVLDTAHGGIGGLVVYLGHVERRRRLLDLLAPDTDLGEAVHCALANRDGEAVDDDRGHDDKVDHGLEDAGVSGFQWEAGKPRRLRRDARSLEIGSSLYSLAQVLAVAAVGKFLHRELGVEHGPDAHGAKVACEELILDRLKRGDPWRLVSETGQKTRRTRARTQGRRRRRMTRMPRTTRRHGSVS